MPLQFKYQQVKELDKDNINLFQTKHSFSLQKSRYLMIESTEKGLQKLADLQKYVLEKNYENVPLNLESLEDQKLELHFKHRGEVNKKRNKLIIFK